MTLKNLSSQLGDHLPATDDVLRLIGLQQQRAATDVTFSMLGAFALGTLLGGALALLFAPKTGEEMRHDLGARLDDATHRVKERLATNSGEMAEHQLS